MTRVQPLQVEGQSKPIGRYSPATIGTFEGPAALVCISGQVATDAAGNILGPGDPHKQAEIVFGRLMALLKSAGGTPNDLLAVTIFLTDRRNFPAINEVRNAVFRDHAPASTCVLAELMEPGCLVEVNGLALIAAAKNGDTR
jgi:2-iminobutanoate/2-iminopropanoate deaminase